MTDFPSLLAETYREVGRRRIAAGEARTALMRRRYEAPIEDVWDACTNPDRINRWFLPVTGDFRAGGTFQLEGNASGEILRCEPPRLLTVTWAYGDRPVDEVELRLSPDQNGVTILELEHATVSTLVEWEGQMLDVIPGVGAGWEPALDYLRKFLRRELPDAPAVEWYRPTPEDEELVNRYGQAWAALVETAGTAGRTGTQDKP
jgi:uncharacterized protein YndB with AHSA1/START domain